ncbi:MAG: glycoside hydrolase domain-containing protein [Planctomycetota bacterium]
MSDSPILEDVDPFMGSEPMDVPVPDGLASKWFFPKPMIGNTHPGAALPFGMVTACAYTGGYPTGYGRWGKCLQGVPDPLSDDKQCTGFTHFHPSGVGAIRKYYNYTRVVPVTEAMGGVSAIDQPRRIINERAWPGTYACELEGTGITAELTITSRGAVHRYTFAQDCQAMIALDLSHGGIAIEDGRTLPQRAHCRIDGANTAQSEVVLEGVSLCTAASLRYYDEEPTACLWEDGQPIEHQEDLTHQYIRPSTFKPFGVLFSMPVKAGHQLELRLGFSWRTVRKARKHLPTRRFEVTSKRAAERWSERLDAIEVEGGSAAQRRVFRTSQYRCLIKPCEAKDESPFWPWDGPFYFDMSTMWDIYKTQLPLALSLYPDFGRDFVNALLSIVEIEGNFPVGYRMARGFDRFAHQASALAHVTIADALTRGIDGIDWERAATMMARDISRGGSGEAFTQQGLVHPITHTLDLAYGCYCTARVAEHIGDDRLHAQMIDLAALWQNAYNAETGLLKQSTFYEGGKWNYSFRLLHDMPGRIALSGGTKAFVEQLDRFFGWDREPAPRVGRSPSPQEMQAGYDLHRFEGLCNEPDMEVPYAYAFAGRHDRVCDIVREGLKLFTPTPGGMVGNDDSGGMTSWYVWSAIGLFPVAGQDVFILGTPIFERVVLHLPGGDLTLEAPETSETRRYIAQATLNGEPLNKPFLRWADLQGGHLQLEMTETPNGWGNAGPE